MDLSEFEADNTKNLTLESSVPSRTKKEPCMLGIDEAGRGPVLGPMVYAAAYCPISCLDSLKEKGFADSKTLSEDQREDLFDVIDQANDMIGWVLEILSPNVISNNMLRRCKYNLNALSHDSAIMLLKEAISLGVNVTEVYVDTVGPPEKYQAKLSSIFPDIKIIVSKKADSIFPIVSAASICAKVARDNALKTWRFTEGEEFTSEDYGSGYPNDPVTKKFLANNVDPVFGFPQLIRFSWSTADKILGDKAVEVSWEEEEDEKSTNGNTPKLLNFMKKKTSKKPKSDAYFTQRNLHQVTDL